MVTEHGLSRRSYLRTAVGSSVFIGGITGVTSATKPAFDGWLSETSNYNGLLDQTGEEEVTVEVGVKANADYYGFGPPAVRVSPDTTIVWRWTGRGGNHTVTSEDGGEFESGLHTQEGYTFSHRFESSGIYKYRCTPHQAFGMKGVVVVGDVTLPGGSDAQRGSAPSKSNGDGATAPSGTGRDPWPTQFLVIAGLAGGFVALIVVVMLGLTAMSIRKDAHSPAVFRDE